MAEVEIDYILAESSGNDLIFAIFSDIPTIMQQDAEYAELEDFWLPQQNQIKELPYLWESVHGIGLDQYIYGSVKIDKVYYALYIFVDEVEVSKLQIRYKLKNESNFKIFAMAMGKAMDYMENMTQLAPIKGQLPGDEVINF